MTVYYLLKSANNYQQAIIRAKSLCRCVRKSFAGVSWLESGEEQRLTWEEVDGEQA